MDLSTGKFLFVCLSVCPSIICVCLSASPSVFLSYASVCLSLRLSVYHMRLSTCLSVHLSYAFIICLVYLSFYHIHLSLFHLSIHPSIYLSIYLSVYPSVCLSVSPLSRFLLFLLSLFHQNLQSKLCQANKSYMHFQFHFILIFFFYSILYSLQDFAIHI